MEKVSPFFVIIAMVYMIEVIYVKKIGIIIATIYLGAVLYLEFVKTIDWKSLLILFCFFFIWALIVFASLAAFFENRDIKFLGIEISAKKSSNVQTEEAKLNNEGLKRQEKIDFHKEFTKIEFPTVEVKVVGEYRTPRGIGKLAMLVSNAKKAGYNLKEDNAYLDVAGDAQKEIVNQLFLSIENYDKEDYAISHHYEKIMDDALYESNFNKDDFIKIKLDLVDHLGHKEAINHRFERAINDLNKISA